MYRFRPVTVDDFPAICDLITNEEELFLVYPSGKFPLTVEQLGELAQRRKELTVAMEGDSIVGFADFYDLDPGKSVFIGNVVVAEAYRGRGLGRTLVTEMINKAFGAYDLPEVRLSVFGGNNRALLLYAGLGFVPYQIDQRLDAKGRRLALIHMRLYRH